MVRKWPASRVFVVVKQLLMTKNRKSYGGLERCRNFRNLNESEPDARPVPVKVDPLQADVVATKWVAPSSLSAPPSAGPQVSRRGPGWRPVLRSARWQGQETLPQLGGQWPLNAKGGNYAPRLTPNALGWPGSGRLLSTKQVISGGQP